MDKKTTGLIATIATAILCGCPGLVGLCMGAMFAFVGAIPGSDIDIGGSNDPAAAVGTGVAMLCVGVVFVAIPIVVGIVTLRNKPQGSALSAVDAVVSEPQPPAPPNATTVSQPEPPVPPNATEISQPKPPVPPADDDPLPPAS